MGCNNSLKMIILIVLTLQEVPCVCVYQFYMALIERYKNIVKVKDLLILLKCKHIDILIPFNFLFVL